MIKNLFKNIPTNKGGKIIHRLTAVVVKQAIAKEKPYKLSDGGGLHLLVRGFRRYWRYSYRFHGKQKTLALGVYPDVSLADARSAHQSAREQLSAGTDPADAKKIAKVAHKHALEESFEQIAREWFGKGMCDKSLSHQNRTLRLLERDLFPKLGRWPISVIAASDLMRVLRGIELRSVEMAHRAKQVTGQVFRFAMATGRAHGNISHGMTSALKPKNTIHHATITDPLKVGQLMLAIDGYDGTLDVKAALKFSALVFQRPGEIRRMEWQDMNWHTFSWVIPASKMRTRQDHIVPISNQAKTLLLEQRKLTGSGKYVFPSARGKSRPLSENGVRTALRAMGYDNETMTPHGFRATASTILDEVLNFKRDWIELQLAYVVKVPDGQAYKQDAFLIGRRRMMQTWADYLDYLVESAQGTVSFRVRSKYR